MNVEKLIALLNSRQLYLSRLDNLADPWEGAWPTHVVTSLRAAIPTPIPNEFFEFGRQTFFVSCWHASPHQSAALWDQYGASAGFALRSTVGALKNSIKSDTEFFIGRVQYVDYESPIPPSEAHGLFGIASMKRLSFQHEQEVRLLVWRYQKQGDKIVPENVLGLSVDVDLTNLVQAAFVSPRAPKWMVPHIRRLVEVFGLSIDVVRSDLYDPYVL